LKEFIDGSSSLVSIPSEHKIVPSLGELDTKEGALVVDDAVDKDEFLSAETGISAANDPSREYNLKEFPIGIDTPLAFDITRRANLCRLLIPHALFS
jgi:hypothetical protein